MIVFLGIPVGLFSSYFLVSSCLLPSRIPELHLNKDALMKMWRYAVVDPYDESSKRES